MNGDPQSPPSTQPPAGIPPGWAPQRRPGDSGMAIAALVISIISIVLCWIPFAGFLGVLGLIFAIVALTRGRRDPRQPRSQGKNIASVVMSALAIIAAVVWVVMFATFSCPRVYSFDGQVFRLDADALSGSLFAGGESTDNDRLEHLVASRGQYRIMVKNDLEETDHIDEVALQVVDHPPHAELLPSQQGALLPLTHKRPPLQCRDRRGRAQLDLVRHRDGRSFRGRAADFSPAERQPREQLTMLFERPPGDRAVLILRGRNTEFAVEAFARYLARMGPGLGRLLTWAQDSSSYPYRKRLDDEKQRLGLLLQVQLWDGRRWQRAATVQPIGPAVLRSQAVPLALPPGDQKTLGVRLVMAPLLWELDQLQLAPAPLHTAAPLVLRPRTSGEGVDPRTARLLAEADRARLTLAPGESTELRFDAPPPVAGLRRTVVLKIRGYYEFRIGGRGWLNPWAVMRHRSGADSLPRYALELARQEGPGGSKGSKVLK